MKNTMELQKELPEILQKILHGPFIHFFGYLVSLGSGIGNLLWFYATRFFCGRGNQMTQASTDIISNNANHILYNFVSALLS